MDRKKLITYGAIGVGVLAIGFVGMRVIGARSAAASDASSAGTSYFPPTVIGSGASGSTSADTGTSTDSMISSLLASQLSQTNTEYDYKNKALESNERMTLATLDAQKYVTDVNANASIEQSLAAQLGSIIGLIPQHGGGGITTGLQEIAGGIGFHNGNITLDIAGSSTWGKEVRGQEAVDKVKQSPLLTGLTGVTTSLPTMPATSVNTPAPVSLPHV